MKTQIKTILMTLLLVASFSFTACSQEASEKKHWSDVVTSRPAGYVVGEDGNITISDAEGFAWIISVVNGLNGEKANSLEGKTILITNNLDMSQYQWTPLKTFNATIKGDNVEIKGLPVKTLFDLNNDATFHFHIEGVTFDVKYWSISFPAQGEESDEE